MHLLAKRYLYYFFQRISIFYINNIIVLNIFVYLVSNITHIMFEREIKNAVLSELVPGKVIKIFGSRRVGKTVLLEQIESEYTGKVSVLNGEDYNTERLLSERTISNYRQLLSGTDLLIIDEAQNIKEIGLVLKLMVDAVKTVSILVSGSSSFDLHNKTGEPLVGRSYEFKLFPLSINELLQKQTFLEINKNIEDFMVYGNYPELCNFKDFSKKLRYLNEISNSYLLKDLLMIDGIKNSSKMRDLLRLVSFQIGSIVSYDELGKQLGISRNTVEKYLDLLSKTFVIYKLPAYSTNPRKEISKSSKWYFYDNGIRNAVIGDFRPLHIRSDIGALWENFMISERIKNCSNKREISQFYFWRNYAGSEIDLIEETNSNLKAFEFKWTGKELKTPLAFAKNYSQIDYKVISRNNLVEFLNI